jgi:hypothetical protein
MRLPKQLALIGRLDMAPSPSSPLLHCKASSMIVAFLCVSGSGPSLGQTPATNSGTLMCTVANVPTEPAARVELSCNFKSQAGGTSDYAGTAGTKAGGFPPAKHVFVWTVVATDVGKAPMLEGDFSAETGRQGAAVLIGGSRGSIRLEPVTGKEQLAGPAEITTLTLKLAATKT